MGAATASPAGTLQASIARKTDETVARQHQTPKVHWARKRSRGTPVRSGGVADNNVV
jgi:hypothetical protein